MSLPKSVKFTQSAGHISAVKKALRGVNLRPAKRILVSFDPLHEQASHPRHFLHYFSASKIANTNPNCIIKSEIFCDRREPTVTISLLPDCAEKFGSAEIVFKQGNLTCLETIQLLNKYFKPLIPKEETPEVQTKSERKQRKK